MAATITEFGSSQDNIEMDSYPLITNILLTIISPTFSLNNH